MNSYTYKRSPNLWHGTLSRGFNPFEFYNANAIIIISTQDMEYFNYTPGLNVNETANFTLIPYSRDSNCYITKEEVTYYEAILTES